jgi:hypothetical protein
MYKNKNNARASTQYKKYDPKNMSVLQCFGCRTRRQTAQDSSSKLIRKARILIARIGEQFNLSVNFLNEVPQSIPEHDDYPSTKSELQMMSNIGQANFNSAELMKRRTLLQDRQGRFEKTLLDTPPNTPKYNGIQAQSRFVQRQIRELQKLIEMQQINDTNLLEVDVRVNHTN